jgi:hypothetical protein
MHEPRKHVEWDDRISVLAARSSMRVSAAAAAANSKRAVSRLGLNGEIASVRQRSGLTPDR